MRLDAWLALCVFGAALSFAWPRAAWAASCKDSTLTLELFLKNLPRNAYLCRDVGDCAPRYLRADSCAAPVILGALGDKVIGDVAGRLIPLQAEKRKNCPESKVACSPVTVPYDCVKNLCAELPQ